MGKGEGREGKCAGGWERLHPEAPCFSLMGLSVTMRAVGGGAGWVRVGVESTEGQLGVLSTQASFGATRWVESTEGVGVASG